MPQIDTETLKKTIIFIEYSIRTKDPTLGNIYKKRLESFYDRIKVKNIINLFYLGNIIPDYRYSQYEYKFENSDSSCQP